MTLHQISRVGYYALIINIIAIMCFSYKNETVVISYITFFVSSAIMILHIILRKEKIDIDNLYIMLSLFFIWCLASNLWSLDFSISIVSTITVLQLTLYCLVLYEFMKYADINADELVKAVGIGTLFMGGYALIYYGVSDFWDALINGIRLGNEVNQENIFSGFAGLGCLAWAGLFLKKRKFDYLLACFFSIILILLGGSRGSFLVMCFCLFLLYFQQMKIYKINLHRVVAMCIVFIVVLLFIHLYAEQLDVFQRLLLFGNYFSAVDDADSSTMIRINMIYYGIQRFIDQPLQGYGLNCYRVLLLEYMGWSTYSHNNFIELLCDIGVIGFALYYKIYYSMWKSRKKSHLILLSFVLFTFFNGLFEPNYYSKVVYIIFAFYFANLKNMDIDDKKYNGEINVRN